MGSSTSRSLLLNPSIWVATVLLLLIIVGAGFLGPLSAEPRLDLVLPERSLPEAVIPPAPSPEAVPEQEPVRDPGPGLAHATIGALIVLATVAAYIMVNILKRLRSPDQEPGDAADSAVDLAFIPGESITTIRTHLTRATEILAGPANSADAVIECWLQLEAATSHAGRARKPHETPSEYAAAVLHRFEATPADVSTLMTEYERIRFAPGDHRPEISPDRLAEVQTALNRVTTAVHTFMDRQDFHANA